jgi:serine/threonine protein kinase
MPHFTHLLHTIPHFTHLCHTMPHFTHLCHAIPHFTHLCHAFLTPSVSQLADFGLAAVTDDLRAGVDFVCGTPSFLAPEMLTKDAYDDKVMCGPWVET